MYRPGRLMMVIFNQIFVSRLMYLGRLQGQQYNTGVVAAFTGEL